MYSLVEFKLCHCDTVWGNCNLSLKSKLQNLQNRAVRIVSKDYSSPIEEVFINLKLLNVQQLIDFDTATLIYKSQHNLTPQYTSDMFVSSGIVYGHNTRHTVNGLFIPHCKSTYGSRCFAQIGSRQWNNHLMMFRQLQVLTPLNLVFEIIFSKGNSYSLANVAKNKLLTLLPVLHISVFILEHFLYISLLI